MPYFDLKCSECDWKGEVKCKYEELKEQECEVCGSLTERLYTANSTKTVGATFTGSGWFRNGTH